MGIEPEALLAEPEQKWWGAVDAFGAAERTGSNGQGRPAMGATPNGGIAGKGLAGEQERQGQEKGQRTHPRAWRPMLTAEWSDCQLVMVFR